MSGRSSSAAVAGARPVAPARPPMEESCKNRPHRCWRKTGIAAVQIHTGACDVDTGAYGGRREQGFSMIGFHGIMPETENTTYDF